MLCLSGFELHSLWVPLKISLFQARRSLDSREQREFLASFISRRSLLSERLK